MKAELIAVSSSGVGEHGEIAAKIGATFPILADPTGETIRSYGMLHPGGNPFGEIPIARPGEFLIDETGVIRARFLTENWRVRERPEHLLDELGKLPAPPQ